MYYVYILTNKPNGTLYIGVTNDLMRRLYEHKIGAVDGFSKKYNTHTLVYYEECELVNASIQREKQLKNWHRQWKLNLIEQHNPLWGDLSSGWYDVGDAETSSA